MESGEDMQYCQSTPPARLMPGETDDEPILPPSGFSLVRTMDPFSPPLLSPRIEEAKNPSSALPAFDGFLLPKRPEQSREGSHVRESEDWKITSAFCFEVERRLQEEGALVSSGKDTVSKSLFDWSDDEGDDEMLGINALIDDEELQDFFQFDCTQQSSRQLTERIKFARRKIAGLLRDSSDLSHAVELSSAGMQEALSHCETMCNAIHSSLVRLQASQATQKSHERIAHISNAFPSIAQRAEDMLRRLEEFSRDKERFNQVYVESISNLSALVAEFIQDRASLEARNAENLRLSGDFVEAKKRIERLQVAPQRSRSMAERLIAAMQKAEDYKNAIRDLRDEKNILLQRYKELQDRYSQVSMKPGELATVHQGRVRQLEAEAQELSRTIHSLMLENHELRSELVIVNRQAREFQHRLRWFEERRNEKSTRRQAKA
eukprot:750756-Hanusia_phi.AAC.4